MFEIVAGELRAKLGTVSAMRQLRSGRDTCAVAGPGRTTRRCAKPHISTPRPTGVEGPEGPAAVPVGGGGAWSGFEMTRRATHQHTRHHRCGGCRRDLPRCRWVAAGPGRASSQRAERSSRRGRRAGGPPPTGTHSGRAIRHPEHPWGHTQRRTSGGTTSNANARQPERAAARSRSQWNTQRSRAATTSATWTAFRAAPLRRLSPETTRTRPRLPSTAWS